ncbi:hypothetical protein JCM21714_839 [Gracilibacillus boraciitolerans JCM 21714]|uniref:Uncharacterized protein n=1 Tax=Gracilibacillus boraciitolerans JCM 21714 TaxID=1298598 RepID=W4VGC8_9BACI|nr:hypothetical protein [Gracilibacillus boraciitolerans]GAE91873.1 hypothetical protein JCM21714_839 [Gracilibacillus boraciitolerans JCM 21714]
MQRIWKNGMFMAVLFLFISILVACSSDSDSSGSDSAADESESGADKVELRMLWWGVHKIDMIVH